MRLHLDDAGLRGILVALAVAAGACAGGGDPKATPVCGNGVVEGGEECDDGNDVAGDGCEAGCRFSCVAAANCDDGNPCTTDSCEANANGRACSHVAAGAVACDDGNGCTSSDTCDGTTCRGTPSCECVVNGDCASREDGDLCNGTLVCAPGTHTCVVDPATIVTCSTASDTMCRKNRCAPATGVCGMVNESNGIVCTDGNACTTQETCQAGLCVSAGLLDCDDGASCTQDACDAVLGGCVHTPVPAACDDGVACTIDACDPQATGADAATGCVSTPSDAACDDSNACTIDACAAGGGCTHTPLAAWFEDSDGDGYGNPAVSVCAAAAPSGFVGNSGDCCDSSASTRPGQSAYFTTANGCGSFDYDCSGVAQGQFSAGVACSWAGTCNMTAGYLGGVPPCGQPGSYQGSCAVYSCGTFCTTCSPVTITVTQACH